MARSRLTACVVMAVLSLAPAAGGSAGDPGEYREAAESSMAQNRAQGPSNVTFAGNILCSIVPFDAADTFPSWHASGAGGVDWSHGITRPHPTDEAAFGAICATPSLPLGFTLTVTYGFQYYRGSGVWDDVAEVPFTCSVGSSEVGSVRFAHLEVPGTPGCPYDQVYDTWHPSITKPHRLAVELTASTANGDGPRIKGWTLPWLLPLKPRA